MTTLSLAPHNAVGHDVTCDRVTGPIRLPAYVRNEDRSCTVCGCVLVWRLNDAISDYMTAMSTSPHNARQEAARVRLNGMLSPTRKDGEGL